MDLQTLNLDHLIFPKLRPLQKATNHTIPVLKIVLSSKYLNYISAYILTYFQRCVTDSKCKNVQIELIPL